MATKKKSSSPSKGRAKANWQISDKVCVLSDSARHLAHVVKLGDRWFAFDGTHSNEEGSGFLFLGSFAIRETAMDAAEESVL